MKSMPAYGPWCSFRRHRGGPKNWARKMDEAFAIPMTSGRAEVHLAFGEVDAEDGDAEMSAGLVDVAATATAQVAADGVKRVEIVGQRRDVDQSREKKIRQFDQEPKVRRLRDDCRKGLGGFGAGLGLEIFQEFELFGFLFGLGGGAFLPGEVLGQPMERLTLALGSPTGMAKERCTSRSA